MTPLKSLLRPAPHRTFLNTRHALRCQVECGVGTDDFGYPNALVQTNNSSSPVLMQLATFKP